MSGNKLVVQNDGSNVDVLRVESSRGYLHLMFYNCFRRRIIEDKNGPILESTADKGIGLFSQDTFTGDGSTTTFDMTNEDPDGGGNEIQVFVDNVRQQEGSSNVTL